MRSPDRREPAPVLDVDGLAELCRDARRDGRRVVLCHGCFDILHVGHVRHLRAAAAEGDLLVATVTADAYVDKGPGRPVFPDSVRAAVLAAIRWVDAVAVNPAPTAVGVLERLVPHVYVKGGEYAVPGTPLEAQFEAERQVATALGIEVVFTHEEADSSTRLVALLEHAR